MINTMKLKFQHQLLKSESLEAAENLTKKKEIRKKEHYHYLERQEEVTK